MRRDPTVLDPDHGYCAGMDDALRRLHHGVSRKPTDADRPPPSTFPKTPAARAALRLAKQHG